MSEPPNGPPAAAAPASVDPKDHTVGHIDPDKQRIWDLVATSPLHSLWDFQGTPFLTIIKRTAHSFTEDNLLSRAAELGYYFLFALFPTLVSVSAIIGLVARSATDIYVKLLNYLALIVPPEAFKIVLDTFNQTTLHSSGGKIVFGIVAAVWTASVGFTAIQDTLNMVYKVRETRPYWKVRGSAMLVTVLLSFIVTATLASLLAGSYLAHEIRKHMAWQRIAFGLAVGTHIVFDFISFALLILLFAIIYYYAPNIAIKKWRWLTPGGAIAIICWLLASLALRLYLRYFHSFSVTYGSLGAVIILLTWFYVTGLMLLLGAEINSEIEAAAAECRLKAAGAIPPEATTDARAPIPAQLDVPAQS